MSLLTQNPASAGQTLFTSSSTQMHDLGAQMTTPDGRKFRYVKMGAVAAVPGKLYQSAAQDTGIQNLTAVAASAGATEVSFSTTVTVTANQYAGAYIMVSVTPDVGRLYRIKSHAAYTAAAPTFVLEDAIQNAWTTSTRCDVVANPYTAVIVNPATASSAPIGSAIYAIAAGEFGWLQTKGPACLLADGAVTVGTAVVASNAVAGAVEPLTGVQAPVGIALTGIADTEYGAIFLTLE